MPDVPDWVNGMLSWLKPGDPDPVPEPTPEPTPEPKNDPAPDPEPTPEPEKEPTPEPTPEPEKPKSAFNQVKGTKTTNNDPKAVTAANIENGKFTPQELNKLFEDGKLDNIIRNGSQRGFVG